jgi:hypothetical protein
VTVRITPLDQAGDAVELSQGTNLFEKQVLPFGKFNYKGDTFEITPDWADNAIRAFEDKAFDQTPFALADESNSHDVDHRPDRFGGEVLRFVKRPNGLNAILRLTNKVASMVRDNKKLGVSVRFREGYTRDADQKTWPVVIDQVLGTLKPRLTGMAPWKEIALSNLADGTEVADSSTGDWDMTKPTEGKDQDKAPTTSGPADNNNSEDKVTLTKTEYEQFQALLKGMGNGTGNGTPTNGGPNNAADSTNDDDSDIDGILKELEGNEVKVGLSAEAKRVIQLSNEVARSNYERDALSWKQAGVPPKLVELAAPVLSSYDEVKVVSLSDDGSTSAVDARKVVRAILDECKGTINLSVESGHSNRGDEQDEEFKNAYKAILESANEF